MHNIIEMNSCFSTTRRLIKLESEDLEQFTRIFNDSKDKFNTELFLPILQGRQGEGGLRTEGYWKVGEKLKNNLLIGSLNLKQKIKIRDNNYKKPLVSIITVVLNGELFIEETICSVINQSYDNIEFIVIDGGSVDSTLTIIKKYEKKIDYWVSERDAGIYDAMNKGIKACTGDIIAIINADDFYIDNKVFENLINGSENLPWDILCCGVNKIGPKDKFLIKTVHPKQNLLYLGMTTPHPGVFVKSRVYKESGIFDETYKVASDYDFILRCKLSGLKFITKSSVVACMRTGGFSERSIKKGIKEVSDIRKRRLSKLILILSNFLLASIVLKNKFGHSIRKIFG